MQCTMAFWKALMNHDLAADTLRPRVLVVRVVKSKSGTDAVGDPDGKVVVSDVVGDNDGAVVEVGAAGEVVGEVVGTDVVGDPDGRVR